jgi:thiosulfate dehydrogenase
MNRRIPIAPCWLALLAACSSSSEEKRSAAERGQQLFESKALSPSRLNDYTCATCHDLTASEPASKKTGAPLSGVTRRPRFWGGQEVELLRAVNACRTYFMSASEPLDPRERDAEDLYAYLESLEPGDDREQPFTVVTTIGPDALPPGDAYNGGIVYVMACQSCHGAMHTGAGRLSERVPVLPEDTLAKHPAPDYSPRSQHLVFNEKIRHGVFLGYGGTMPPLSAERLSDTEVSDVLQALGVYVDRPLP